MADTTNKTGNAIITVDNISKKLNDRLDRILAQGIHDMNGQALDKASLIFMVNSDPSGRGRYLRWMCDLYKDSYHDLFFEDLYKLTDDIKLFEKVKHLLPLDKRNVLNYSTAMELYDSIKEFRTTKAVPLSKRQLRGDTEVEGEYSFLLDGGEYVVVVPKTHRAACYWGSGSRWCTAHQYAGHYGSYADRGPLLILRYKDSKQISSNVQIHFESDQYMDNDDRPIDVEVFFKKYPDVLNAFIEYIESGDYVVQKEKAPSKYDYQKKFLNSLEKGKTAAARVYLAHGADVNGIESDCVSSIPLSQAIYIKDESDAIKMINILLNHGANVNFKNIKSFISMGHMVASVGNTKILDILLKHGLDLTRTDMWGRTPLHSAMQCGKVEMAKRLMELGLSPDAKDSQGLSPLEFAKMNKQKMKM